jgi:hypothetical protein
MLTDHYRLQPSALANLCYSAVSGSGLGIPDVLGELLGHRAFEFTVERAVFVSTLHRFFVSGSDRDFASWMADYDIPVVQGLELHHFYRAMAWLGEEVEEKAANALAPRCVRDIIEEKLFDRGRDLFTDLSAMFMDTTSLSFYGGAARLRASTATAMVSSSTVRARLFARRCGQATLPALPRCPKKSARSCFPAKPVRAGLDKFL